LISRKVTVLQFSWHLAHSTKTFQLTLGKLTLGKLTLGKQANPRVTGETFTTALEACTKAVNAHLDTVLRSKADAPRLAQAMRYGVFAGGKRLRPFLVLHSAALFGVSGLAPLQVGAALECVHCYSLAHDDLPAMDNDDLRRGQPTLHRAFDEATAILAGDALLTLAFTLLTDRAAPIRPNARLKLIAALAEAAGLDGMLGGQMLDLAAEGRFPEPEPRLNARSIRRLQALKTGALITFATVSGAILAPKSSASDKRALRMFGDQLGLAFQIKDDLLDIEGNPEIVGKALAKDMQAGKATFVALHGLAGAKRELIRASEKAQAALSNQFGPRAAMLLALLDYNREREK
jgi:farnesyl diphosphate synthase